MQGCPRNDSAGLSQTIQDSGKPMNLQKHSAVCLLKVSDIFQLAALIEDSVSGGTVYQMNTLFSVRLFYKYNYI